LPDDETVKETLSHDLYYTIKIGKCVLHFFKDGDFALNPSDMFPGYS
jgi:hypothetical protein